MNLLLSDLGNQCKESVILDNSIIEKMSPIYSYKYFWNCRIKVGMCILACEMPELEHLERDDFLRKYTAHKSFVLSASILIIPSLSAKNFSVA